MLYVSCHYNDSPLKNKINLPTPVVHGDTLCVLSKCSCNWKAVLLAPDHYFETRSC